MNILSKKKLREINSLYYVNTLVKRLKMQVELSLLRFRFKRAEASSMSGKRIESPRNLNLLWVGGNYDQDHSGFIQALKKLFCVTVFVQPNGTYGLGKSSTNTTRALFDYNLRDRHDRAIRDLVERHDISIVMGQMWASTISPETLDYLRAEKGVIVINIAMDDRLPYHWQADRWGKMNGAIGLAHSVDMTLNTTKEVTAWYHQMGFSCQYFPLAGNPEFFFPREKKKFDVVFVGAAYGYRKFLVSSLQKAGISVATFGPGWDAGWCTAEMTSEIFGQAKIVLGVGYVGHSHSVVTLKQRDFDALFTGALYVTSHNPDLEEMLEDGKHVVYYRNAKDLVKIVSYYLKNDAERNRIAQQARIEGIKNHSWDTRLSRTLYSLGILAK